MRRRYLLCSFIVATLAACGGGGGGGSSPGSTLPIVQPTSTSNPAPSPNAYATLAPPSARLGDVKTLAVGKAGTAIAYWPDYNIVALASGAAIIDAADGTALAASADGSVITAVAYSGASHAMLFASGNGIYSVKTPNQTSLVTVATGFHNVESIATASDGTVYAIDTDHVVKISGGVPTNLTAPGTIGPRYWNGNPSIVVASDGSLLVSDPSNDVVSHVTTAGAMTPFVGGCKSWKYGGAGTCWHVNMPGTGTNANFGAPAGLAYNPTTGTLYVADVEDSQLWSVSAAGVAAPVAGYGWAQNVDGNGFAAFLNQPVSIAFQPANGSVDILENAGTSQQEIAAFSTTGSVPPGFLNPTSAIFFQQGLADDDLAASPDGGAWATDGVAIDRFSASGVLTKYTAPTGVYPTWHVAVDANNNAWYLANHFSGGIIADEGILAVTASGATRYIVVPAQRSSGASQMESIAIGPDGNPWFSESELMSGGSIGFVNPSTDALTQYALTTAPGNISQGPGGTVAFSNSSGAYMINFASLNGTTTASYPVHIGGTNGLQYRTSDATTWFTDTVGTISKISSTGVETDYRVCSQCDPVNLTVAPDGSIWSDEGNSGGGIIIRITPSGQVMSYPLPMSSPTYGISARPDGKLWVYASMGILYLFDPNAYDAMNGPHVSQSKLHSTYGEMGSRWHRAR